MPSQVEKARQRITQVLKFLQGYHTLKVPPKRSLDEYDWSLRLDQLPLHPCVRLETSRPAAESGQNRGLSGFALRVKSPKLTPCPLPPAALCDWLVGGWDRWKREAAILESRNFTVGNQTITIRFDADPTRVQVFAEWKKQREKWIEAERPSIETNTIYEKLYGLYGRLLGDAGKVQLWHGDGILRAKDTVGVVDHPVLLQRVELRFDPAIPEITIVDADDPRELYVGLLGSISDASSQSLANNTQIAACEQELRQDEDIQGFDEAATNRFLRRLIQGVFLAGQFVDSDKDTSPSDGDITIRRRGVLFVAPRTRTVSEAIDAAIRRIERIAESDIPRTLAKIVGVALDQTESITGNADENASPLKTVSAEPKRDFLLTLPANPEQKRVLRQLESNGRVLVQGPPGTGKTHTIANLVGHFLADGKSVLITSDTAKALRVVRDKVVEELQPLCLSVVADDVQCHEDLQSCIDAIEAKLGASDPDELDAEANSIAKERDKLQRRLVQAKIALRQAIRDEYDDILVGGQSESPAEAARQVRAKVGTHDWIPGPLQPQSVLPLSEADLVELYESNGKLTADDEDELLHQRPRSDSLMAPRDFHEFIRQLRDLRQLDFREVQAMWTDPVRGVPSNSEIERFSQCIASARSILSEVRPAWWWSCVEDTLQKPPTDRPWFELLKFVDGIDQQLRESSAVALSRHVEFKLSGQLRAEALAIFRQILSHLRNGGKLNWSATLFRSAWKNAIQQVRVDGRLATSSEDVDAIVATLQQEESRKQLLERWNRQMGPLECAIPLEMQSEPERFCRLHVSQIVAVLEWSTTVAEPLQETIRNAGVRWDQLERTVTPIVGKTPCLTQWMTRIEKSLTLLERRCQFLKLKILESQFAEFQSRLHAFSDKRTQQSVTKRLAVAAESLSPDGYDLAWNRLRQIEDLWDIFSRRQTFLAQLEQSAPKWGQAIRQRISPHDQANPPGDCTQAWLLRQWQQELERRASTDIDRLQQEVNLLSEQFEQITRLYVERRAWAQQRRRRYGTAAWDALVNWLITITTDGYASSPKLKTQAREQLAKGRPAMPVWIMPFTRVMESFDFESAQFDVVIVDEASQCDLRSLLLLLLGKQIVVVGDDRQVSPSAVGMEKSKIQALVAQHLQDVPNSQSYHGRASLYDFAKTFGDRMVCLLEHFRSVPEIIQFSNHLSYRGKVKVLREGSDVVTRPLVISHRVNGIYDKEKNQIEAEEVASLLVATTKQPEYKGLTMGVVSMISSSGQADLIDLLVRRHLDEREYVERRIICGSPAQFQGDERDVMFLSLVDSADSGPLSLRRSKMFRQRFNVAASRAKDQEWVVHSLNPDTDLQPDDLRRRLIQHALNPNALADQLSEANQRAQSGFERDVIRELTSRNYRLATQWPVGAFRIDIVAIGEDDRKVAIECDGDRYHCTPEKIQEDHERQLMLERRGWRFIRIRSSRFYLHPDKTIEQVCARLESLGIQPIGPESNSQHQSDLGDELRERVVRCAEELRKQWKADSDIEEEFKQKRADRRRRFTRKPVAAIEQNIQSKTDMPSENPTSVAKVVNKTPSSSDERHQVQLPINPQLPVPPTRFNQADFETAVLKIVSQSPEPLMTSDVLRIIKAKADFFGVDETDVARALDYFLRCKLMAKDARTQRWSYCK